MTTKKEISIRLDWLNLGLNLKIHRFWLDYIYSKYKVFLLGLSDKDYAITDYIS